MTINGLVALEESSKHLNPVTDEPDDELSITMIRVWDELTPDERQGICALAGVQMGQMSLSKIATIFKAIYYKHQFSLNNPYTQTYGVGSVQTAPGTIHAQSTYTVPQVYGTYPVTSSGVGGISSYTGYSTSVNWQLAGQGQAQTPTPTNSYPIPTTGVTATNINKSGSITTDTSAGPNTGIKSLFGKILGI